MDVFISKQTLRKRHCSFTINSDKKWKPRPTSWVRLKAAWSFPQNQIDFSTRILHHVCMGFRDTQARAAACLATQRLCYNQVRRADLGSGLVRWNSDSFPVQMLLYNLRVSEHTPPKCNLYTVFAPCPSCGAMTTSSQRTPGSLPVFCVITQKEWLTHA